MKKALGVALLTVVFVAGCASSGPPIAAAQFTDTEAEIRAAENAGAATTAADPLGRSKAALAAARQAASKGDGQEAERQVTLAKAFALAAEAKARAEAAKVRAAEQRRAADELEAKAKQIQEGARP